MYGTCISIMEYSDTIDPPKMQKSKYSGTYNIVWIWKQLKIIQATHYKLHSYCASPRTSQCLVFSIDDKRMQQTCVTLKQSLS